ncbi:Protein pih1d3 [Sorochytrium milnesiophthora]
MNADPASIAQLANLFAASDQQEEARKKPQHASVAASKSRSAGKVDDKDIWTEEELSQEDKYSHDVNDARPAPEHSIQYRQKVGTEDIFLGMSGKTPSFQQADELVVRIELPGTESVSDIMLTVKNSAVHLSTAKFLLHLPLPRDVDDTQSNAKWDPQKQELCLSLRITDSLPS